MCVRWFRLVSLDFTGFSLTVTGCSVQVAARVSCTSDQIKITGTVTGSVVISFSIIPAGDGTPVTSATLAAAFTGTVSLPTVGVRDSLARLTCLYRYLYMSSMTHSTAVSTCI